MILQKKNLIITNAVVITLLKPEQNYMKVLERILSTGGEIITPPIIKINADTNTAEVIIGLKEAININNLKEDNVTFQGKFEMELCAYRRIEYTSSQELVDQIMQFSQFVNKQGYDLLSSPYQIDVDGFGGHFKDIYFPIKEQSAF